MVLQGVDMKYIDPSYQIRAVPTNCNDRIYCKVGAITSICEVYNASTMKSIIEVLPCSQYCQHIGQFWPNN